jgi:hypothetical protein
MRIVEAADHRAVRIAVAIRVAVVAHVVPSPPQRTLLHRRRPDKGPDEARDAIHLEGTMREIAMERQRQADGAHEMRGRPERDHRPGERNGEHEQRRQLYDPENRE